MTKKTLAIFLILFFVLSGASWGIERVEGEGKIRKVTISAGWTSGVSADDFVSGGFFVPIFNPDWQALFFYPKPKDFSGGLSAGIGYLQSFNSRLFWEFNFRYYYYHKKSQVCCSLSERSYDVYLTSRILEYNFTLKDYFFSTSRNPLFNPYMGIGASLVYDIFEYDIVHTLRFTGFPRYYEKEDKLLPALTGCLGLDFNPTDVGTFFFDVNFLLDLRSAKVKLGVNTLFNATNVRIGLGFARKF